MQCGAEQLGFPGLLISVPFHHPLLNPLQAIRGLIRIVDNLAETPYRLEDDGGVRLSVEVIHRVHRLRQVAQKGVHACPVDLVSERRLEYLVPHACGLDSVDRDRGFFEPDGEGVVQDRVVHQQLQLALVVLDELLLFVVVERVVGEFQRNLRSHAVHGILELHQLQLDLFQVQLLFLDSGEGNAERLDLLLKSGLLVL